MLTICGNLQFDHRRGAVNYSQRMHTQVVRGLIIAMLTLVVSHAVAFADPRKDANTDL